MARGRAGVDGLGGSELCVSAPLVALQGRGHEFGKLTLLDTPGTNEAGEAQLQQVVERLLNSIDCVLYVLDYTKLKTKDEEELLKMLSAVNPQLLKRLSSRLFFVVNKADEAEASGGLTADEVRHYVANLVSRQLGGAGAAEATGAGAGAAPPRFSLSPKQVLPVSARNALLARQVLSGRLDAETRKRFLNRAFGEYGCKMPFESLPVAPSAIALLEGSGIPELESSVLGFLSSNASAIKLLATLDDFVRFLGQVRNVALACRAALRQDASALADKTERLRTECQDAVKDLEKVRAKTDKLLAEVDKEVRQHFENLRCQLHDKIGHTLNAYGGTHAWPNVQHFFKSILGPGNPGALADQLKEPHDDVMGQRAGSYASRTSPRMRRRIHDDVGNFWGNLERDVSGRHAQLIEELNTHLTVLAGRVEGAMAEQLNVALKKADIGKRKPTPEELHADVQELVRKGINRRQEWRSRSEKKIDMVEERRQAGLCGWGSTYVQVPHERYDTVQYTESVYSLEPNAIAGYFIGLVDTAIDNSQKALSGFLRQVIEEELAQARSRIKDFGSRYLGALEAASDATKRGAAYKAAADEQVAACIRRLEDLSSRAEQVQQQAAGAALPGAGGDGEAALETAAAAAAADEAGAEVEAAAADPDGAPSSSTPAALPSASSSKQAAGSAKGDYSSAEVPVVPGQRNDGWTIVV